MPRDLKIFTLPLAAFSMAYAIGCSQPPSPPSTDTASSPAKAPTKQNEEHGHKEGANGGIIVPVGRDSYHAEAIFDKAGPVRLFMLGKDETKIQEVDAQTLTAFVKEEGASEFVEFHLQPKPQPGDTQGTTSLFVGVLPAELRGKVVEVTVPTINVKGERFRFGFKSVAEKHGDDMPDKVAGEEERKLYLTPGGKYTEADIKANGGVTASQKYKGAMAKHDMKPKSGDKICPITETKANPKFIWVIGGSKYEFCCPPCVDEFVKLAKEHPEEIKDPKDYVKK